MSKFEQIDPNTASADAKEAFDEAIAQFGAVINLFKVIGSAPNVLKGILALNKEVNSSKWTLPIRNWKPALNRFMIEFEERLTDYI